MYILISLLSLVFILMISFISFNVYFYFLLKKEKNINEKIDVLFIKMFNNNPSKDDFRSMYKAVKKKVKESNKIFDQVESLKKYSIIKVK